MGWKRLIFGEEMPDKDDPKYRKQYEKEVDAGRRTARLLRIDRAAACMQRFALCFPKFFLTLVAGMARDRTTATERQEMLLKDKEHTGMNADTIETTNIRQ